MCLTQLIAEFRETPDQVLEAAVFRQMFPGHHKRTMWNGVSDRFLLLVLASQLPAGVSGPRAFADALNWFTDM